MSADFSPGPWTAWWSEENSRLKLGSWAFSYAGHKPVMLRCSRDNSRIEANARLIAAAPLLYEALEDIVAHEAGGEFHTWARKINAARTALKQARGET